MTTTTGYRYQISISMGVETAVWVSKILYATRGQAIDAMRNAYPDADYPDAERAVFEDEEVNA